MDSAPLLGSGIPMSEQHVGSATSRPTSRHTSPTHSPAVAGEDGDFSTLFNTVHTYLKNCTATINY